MKILTLFLATISFSGVSAQITIDLSRSHNPGKQITYEVDFLRLDSANFFSLSLVDKEIKKVRVKDTVIVVSTKLNWVYNDQILVNRRLIRSWLMDIKTDDIVSLKKISASEAFCRYGYKSTYGAIIIETKR